MVTPRGEGTPGTTSVPLRFFFRRDPLVGSVYQHSIMNCVSAGTEVPR
ncbi:hypothetical protein THTE_0225 [Thermogutta terrifontis]|uniref:Uncharacterized protein n=1 Tax=Thermogutta terrifontis TaxID=1331910 RepID=A0A286RA72_9BACT|nr:hypothetical protein THTE_0225 [Thermogutta terrifontis]